MNELVFELLAAIINQSAGTYYQDLLKGKIIDAWGADLWRNDNLQNQAIKNGTEYFVTYALDTAGSSQLNRCDYSVTYDFSILLSDINLAKDGTAKQRLTRMTDLIIESIVNNQTNFVCEVATSVDRVTNLLSEKAKYSCPLNSTKLLNRTANIEEKIAKQNYFTSNFQLQFKIQKIY